jgi:hypothetical protein
VRQKLLKNPLFPPRVTGMLKQQVDHGSAPLTPNYSIEQ